MLDFWEDTRKLPVCVSQTVIEEAGVIDVNEDGF
jgi:hypothetical protein